jgi:hypothetical protein
MRFINEHGLIIAYKWMESGGDYGIFVGTAVEAE